MVCLLSVLSSCTKSRDCFQEGQRELSEGRSQGDYFYLEEYFLKIAEEELRPALKREGKSEEDIEREIRRFVDTRGRYKEMATFRKGEVPPFVLKKADWFKVMEMVNSREITDVFELRKVCGSPLTIRFIGKFENTMIWHYDYLMQIEGIESFLVVRVDEKWNVLPGCTQIYPGAQPMKPSAIWK